MFNTCSIVFFTGIVEYDLTRYKGFSWSIQSFPSVNITTILTFFNLVFPIKNRTREFNFLLTTTLEELLKIAQMLSMLLKGQLPWKG